MSYTRDKDAHTRRIGAIAALDAVSSRGRADARRRAVAMAQRDSLLSRLAMGAINTGYTGGSGGFRPVIGPGPGLETGGTSTVRSPTSPPAPTGTSGPTATISTKIGTASVTGTRPTTIQQSPPPPPPVIVTDPGSGWTAPPPPPLPPPPPPSPGISSGSSSGGGGGGGGATWTPPKVSTLPPVTLPEIEEPLDVVPQASSSKPSNTKLLIAGGLLLGAYLLWKKD